MQPMMLIGSRETSVIGIEYKSRNRIERKNASQIFEINTNFKI